MPTRELSQELKMIEMVRELYKAGFDLEQPILMRLSLEGATFIQNKQSTLEIIAVKEKTI
jgi:hypothetical protein